MKVYDEKGGRSYYNKVGDLQREYKGRYREEDDYSKLNQVKNQMREKGIEWKRRDVHSLVEAMRRSSSDE